MKHLTDRAPGTPEAPESESDSDTLTLALEEAEAEALAAEATAEAARARARAARLRRRAAAPPNGHTAPTEPTHSAATDTVTHTDDTVTLAKDSATDPDPATTTIADSAADTAAPQVTPTPDDTDPDTAALDAAPEATTDTAATTLEPSEKSEPSGKSDDTPTTRRARITTAIRGASRRRTAAVLLAIALILASCGTGGYAVWNHHRIADRERTAAEFTAAARQGVVALTTLDFNRAPDDVQRVLDNSTGSFREDFQGRSEDFTNVIRQSQVATTGTVNATAIESMTDDSAVVLVAATSQVTNSAGAKQEPRAWRLSVTVTRVGDQFKMSKVEFVP